MPHAVRTCRGPQGFQILRHNLLNFHQSINDQVEIWQRPIKELCCRQRAQEAVQQGGHAASSRLVWVVEVVVVGRWGPSAVRPTSAVWPTPVRTIPVEQQQQQQRQGGGRTAAHIRC